MGILFSRSDVKDLLAEMNARFNRVGGRLNKMDNYLSCIDADLRQPYQLAGKPEARMDRLDKRG